MWLSLALMILSKKFVAGSSLGLGVVALSIDPTTFAAAAVLVIGAIGGAAVLVINALGKMKTDILEKQAVMDAKVDVVSGHVDGTTTAAAAKRTADEDTINSLKHQLAESEKRAALMAQARTSVDIASAVSMNSLPSGPGNTPHSLERIDQNTRETAQNTARTEEVVQELKDK